MDIEKWYPNTIPVPTAKEIKEMFVASKLEIEGIDYEMVAKYLGKYMTREEILDENFEEILYIKEGKMVKKRNKQKTKTLDTRRIGGKTLDTINGNGGGEALDNSDGGGGNKQNKNVNRKGKGKGKVTKKVNN